MSTYKLRSSTTLITDRIPRWFSFGVGAAAREPSPRNTVLSSFLTLCWVSQPLLSSWSGRGDRGDLQLRGFSDCERPDAD